MTLEGKVAVLVSYLKVGILDQDILECKLLIVSQINMRTVTVTGKEMCIRDSSAAAYGPKASS